MSRLEALVRSFHCLRDCPNKCFPGGSFDPEVFIAYARPKSSAGRDAAMFVLGVWSNTDWSEYGFTQRDSGKFDLHGALGNWDREMRQAFIAWAANPWWA